jgi:hypothetical protein
MGSVIFIMRFFVDINTFAQFFTLNIGFFVMSVVIGYTYAFNISLFRNLHRVWMFYSGSRKQLPKYIESMYFPTLITNVVVVMAIFLVLIFTQAAPSVSVRDIFVLMGYMMLVAAITLYLAMIIYCKVKASVAWCNWINGIIYIIFFFSFSFGSIFIDLDSHVICAISIGFSSLLIALILRQWAKSLWGRADLLRGIN